MSSKCKWEGCRSWASKKFEGYCHAHAKKMVPDNPEVIASEAKRAGGIKGGHEKRSNMSKAEKERERVQRQIEQENKEQVIADKLFHDIIQDKNFNLKEAVAECEELGGNRTSLMQELYILWQMADVETRKPKALKEVADIINVKQIELRRWGEDPRFTERRARARINRNEIVALHTDKIVGIDVLQGKKEATKKFYENISELKPPPKSKGDYEVSEAFKEKISEAAGTDKSKTGTLRQTPEEKRESKVLEEILPEFKSPSLKEE